MHRQTVLSLLVAAASLLLPALSLTACSDSSSTPDADGGDAMDDSAGEEGALDEGGAEDAHPDDGSDAEDVEAVFPADHPRIYLNAENRARLSTALTDGRPAATRFRDMVDAQLAGADTYAFSPRDAALLYQLTDNAAYGDYAVTAIEDFVASEEALIAAGERATVAGDSYLYVGEQVGDLAVVYDWCFDRLSATQRDRWLAYANQAVWNVWHPDDAVWGGVSYPWSGWSVDNPSNNYYYSFLRATLLLGLAARGEHPDAEGWITMFRDTKLEAQLFPTFEADLVGGGSREGTGYGVSMGRLFELYDLWQASTGETVADRTGHTRASLLHFLHLTVPTRDRIAPVGDHARDSTAALFDYHRRYLQILDWLYRADPLAPYGQWFLAHCSVPEMGNAFMFAYDFLYDQPALAEQPLEGLYPAYWAPGTGQLYVRSSWADDATWVHFVAGPFTESHAHRDQGSFMLYKNEWLADDQNLRSHSGIRQEETLHNLVRIDRAGATVEMHVGAAPARLTALADDPHFAYAMADVTPIYDADPALTLQQRELVFLKPDVLVVFDRIDAAVDTTRVWQLNSSIEPVVAPTIATWTGGTSTLVATRVLPATVTSTVVDWTTDDDMNAGWRLDESHSSADGRSRFLHVLSLDGAATTVEASPDGTRSGVRVVLADGSEALVRFETDAPGGALQLRDPGGTLVVDATLEQTVATLPIFATP